MAGVEDDGLVAGLGALFQPLQSVEDVGPGGLPVEEQPRLDRAEERAAEVLERLVDGASVGGGAVELEAVSQVEVIVDPDDQEVKLAGGLAVVAGCRSTSSRIGDGLADGAAGLDGQAMGSRAAPRRSRLARTSPLTGVRKVLRRVGHGPAVEKDAQLGDGVRPDAAGDRLDVERLAVNCTLEEAGEVMATLGGRIWATSVCAWLLPAAASASARAFSRLPASSSRLITSGR